MRSLKRLTYVAAGLAGWVLLWSTSAVLVHRFANLTWGASIGVTIFAYAINMCLAAGDDD